MDFKHKQAKENLGTVLVLGKGVTGKAVQAYLESQASRVDDVDFLDESTFNSDKKYDLTIVSPGISEFSELYLTAKQNSAEIVSEVEFAWRESEVDSKWIAITGTNGKTTTTALTDHILKAAGKNSVAVGNIGDTCISQVDGTPKIYVAECSSYQLASTRDFAPDACAILNITPDHIKWHKNLDNYAAAKFKIFENVKDDENSLVFVEDSLRLKVGAHECKFETDVSSPLCELVFDVKDEMQIKGEHNVQNAVCAATLSSHFGVDDETIKKALCSFTPLDHRIEPCGNVNGITYYNDSKATNVDSTIKALSAFPAGNVHLLLGGTDKMSELEPLVNACKSVVKHVICYGEAKTRFLSAFNGLEAVGVKVSECEHLKDAFECAKDVASEGDVVLLSPACASFDEFSGFEERGEFFKSLVKGGM